MEQHGSDACIWKWLTERYALTAEQQCLFERYATLLQERSEHCNLTALQTISDIVPYHFADSLEVTRCVDFPTIRSYVDVGTGAGFPGIPLNICYPEINALLLEVLKKRRVFLQDLIAALSLRHITIFEQDWRTWLRTTRYEVDLICARASLAPAELLRMFQPASPYRTARLAYWASDQWEPSPREQELIRTIHRYTVGDRTRKIVIFALP
jgi:16S rRNA (guanine527-N7)-methyltransferase